MQYRGMRTFQRLIESLGLPLEGPECRALDLVFEDGLPGTVLLHPNGKDVAIDIWCFDAARLTGPQQSAMVRALLSLNHAAWGLQPVQLAIDTRKFVLVHGSRALSDLDGRQFAAWLLWHVDQSRRVRALIQTLLMQPLEHAELLSP